MGKIRGFNRYSITEDGRVWNGKKYIYKWKDSYGYELVCLYKNGKRHYKRVHRLVAEAFIDNSNNYAQVNHKDGNKCNNKVENLEWCTNSYNTQHAYDNNLYKDKRRSHPIKAIKKDNKKKTYIFKSIRGASEKLNLNRKNLTSILKEEKQNNYDYEFVYI